MKSLKLVFSLSLPSILAQLSMCLMSCIDAAMVGRLGSAPAAAVGLVSTTTWIFGSFCYANASGFSVQIAHNCGAEDYKKAQKIFRQGIFYCILASGVLCGLALLVSNPLPHWLGGGEDICTDASGYFFIYSLFLPVLQLCVLCESSLIASGNTKTPGICSMLMCLLDVGFNYLFIFVLDMGVKGAALGTGLAELCAGLFLLVYILNHSVALKMPGWRLAVRQHGSPGALRGTVRRMMAEGPRKGSVLGRAFDISWPLWIQNLVTRGAYIAATVLIAPLGTVAVAANSFAIIAEGFCYLPGYGVQDAATSLVGRSLGAGNVREAKKYSALTIATGSLMMAALAVLMYAFAPWIMSLLSEDSQVIGLGASCLRIQAWAEPLFGVSIVATGCLLGAADTKFTSFVNLLSMWVVRIGLAFVLIPRFGLEGYWIAMAVELSVKGFVLALRVFLRKYPKLL